LSIYAEGEQQDESGTGEGAKRAINNLPAQPSVIKVKSLYVTENVTGTVMTDRE
jgi:hypothetical protein